MRVLICPDKFAGTASAVDVADAVAGGWSDVAADDVLIRLPLADGGPGMLDALERATGARRVTREVWGPLGRRTIAQFLLHGSTAYIESAQACGLHLVEPGQRDPLRATSFGLGQLMLAAVEAGARTLVVGLGGSATNDGGAGMLAAVGLTPRDQAGRPLEHGGAALTDCVGIDGTAMLREAKIIAATDVDNPLCGIHGASAIFGPQKGADDNSVQMLDHGLSRFGQTLSESVPGCPADVAQLPGAGAAGGLGAGLFALGAHRESGTDVISRAVGLEAAMDATELVITGEGSFDHQSLRGKLVSGVAAAAAARGVPCTVVAGRVTVGRRDIAAAGIDRTCSLAEHFGSESEAMARPLEGLHALASKLAHQWQRRRH